MGGHLDRKTEMHDAKTQDPLFGRREMIEYSERELWG
jgi:hypothetical protein